MYTVHHSMPCLTFVCGQVKNWEFQVVHTFQLSTADLNRLCERHVRRCSSEPVRQSPAVVIAHPSASDRSTLVDQESMHEGSVDTSPVTAVMFGMSRLFNPGCFPPGLRVAFSLSYYCMV